MLSTLTSAMIALYWFSRKVTMNDDQCATSARFVKQHPEKECGGVLAQAEGLAGLDIGASRFIFLCAAHCQSMAS
jgi:hypothetical protein